MYHTEDKLYCYPNSNVLRNRLDLQNAEDLAAFEAVVVAARTAQVIHNDDTFEFSFAFLKELHRHLFQDVYIWAGETRKVHISKGGTRFAAWETINDAAELLFNQTAFAFDSVTPPSPEHFFDAAANFFVELNVIHPFREGNGRVSRLFVSLWAQSWGYTLDWNRVRADDVIAALIHGVTKDDSLAREILWACWDIDASPEN